jgi:glucosamine--fructose-6-phosphate aminotransferase (isomerizing)
MSYLEQEIAEQPDVIERLIVEGQPLAKQIAQAIREADPAFVVIAARGTSDNAGRYAQYLFGITANLSVGLAAPSIHTLYGAKPNLSRALVIGISQSGRAEDVRQVISDARQQGALTVTITNDPDSPLAQAAAYHLPVGAGPELSVAATKTYTTELTAIAMIATELADRDSMRAELHQLPTWVRETVNLAKTTADWAQRYRYMDRFASIGRSLNYCTAFEISLKIKELCYITGVEYSEADFRHGPIALIQPGFPVICVAPKGQTLPGMVDLLHKLKERNAECLVISNAPEALALAQSPMPIAEQVPEWLSPIVSVIPGQLLAMNVAIAKGHTIDRPTGLNKVTVTR